MEPQAGRGYCDASRKGRDYRWVQFIAETAMSSQNLIILVVVIILILILTGYIVI